MNSVDPGAPYSEGVLKAWVRRRFASKESRAGVSKEDAWHERMVSRICCGMAIAYFLVAMLFTPVSRLLWAQAVAMMLCVFWCVLAGLFESGCKWQRESMSWPIDSARDLTQPPTQDDIAMLDSLADLHDASDDDVDKAWRRELGGE
jgi:hypothetical protein